jgi:hypothetical protein
VVNSEALTASIQPSEFDTEALARDLNDPKVDADCTKGIDMSNHDLMELGYKI